MTMEGRQIEGGTDMVQPMSEIRSALAGAIRGSVPLSSIQYPDRAKDHFANPRQVKGFEEGKIQSLANSIKKLGLLQSIGIREMPDGTNQLIWGERRCRAITLLVEKKEEVFDPETQTLRLASEVYEEIPCRILRNCTDEQAIQSAWVENNEHEDLSQADVMDLCDRLHEYGYSRKEICDLLNVSESWLSVTFSFKEKLPTHLYNQLRTGQITRSFAAKILSQPAELRNELQLLAEQIASERHQEIIQDLEEEEEMVEERLTEIETQVALDEVEDVEKAKKKITRLEKKAEKIQQKKEKVAETGPVLNGKDLDKAIQKSDKAQKNKPFSFKGIHKHYLSRIEELQTQKKYHDRDLNLAKHIAMGIAGGTRNIEEILEEYYNTHNLWDNDGAMAKAASVVKTIVNTMTDDEDAEEDLTEIPDDDFDDDGEIDDDLDDLDDEDLDDLDLDDDDE